MDEVHSSLGQPRKLFVGQIHHMLFKLENSDLLGCTETRILLRVINLKVGIHINLVDPRGNLSVTFTKKGTQMQHFIQSTSSFCDQICDSSVWSFSIAKFIQPTKSLTL